MLNDRLQAQIDRYLHKGNPLSAEIQNLLHEVNQTYNYYELENNRLETSVEQSAKEMLQLYGRLNGDGDNSLGRKAYQRILNNLDEVVFSIDLATNQCQFVSDVCEKVYGYSVVEFKANPALWHEVAHEDDRRFASLHDQQLENSEPVELEYRIMHKNKGLRWVNVKVLATVDDDGLRTRIDMLVRDITDSKRLTRKLEAANQELELLLDNINDVVFTVDFVRYKLTHMSSASIKVYGYKPSEFYQNDDLWQTLILEDDAYVVEEQMQQLFQGIQVTNQYRIRHKDGHVNWVENNVIPTLNNDGQLIRIDGITRDITSRKQTELALQQSEQAFRELFESAPEMIMIFDTDTRKFVDMNQKAINSFKLSREEIMQHNPTELSPEFQPDGKLSHLMVEEVIKQTLKGQVPKFEWVHINAEGSEFYCEVTLKLLPIPGKHLIRASAVDITEKKAAERAIRESEERFRLISQTPNLGITWGSPNGRLIEVNKAFADMLGYTQEEMIGMSYTKFVHPVESLKYQEEIMQLLNGDMDTFRGELRYLTKTKKAIWVHLNISSIKDEKGRVRYTIAVLQDITARKEAEKQLYGLNESLEQKVQERTARLEEANKDLEAFNYTVSHDLRTPLRGLDMFRTLLERELNPGEDTDIKKYLDNIRTCTKEMDEMIQHLLEFAKAGREIGAQELVKKNINMQVMVSELAKQLATLNPEKQIEWQIDNLPEARADVPLIKQVWTNLLTNAIKYSSKKEVIHIHVSGHEEGGQAWFCVKDNGVGFSDRQAERLFKPFSRLHSPKDFEGNGAGLAIVHKIITFHNGTVSATAKPGEGATFCFTLPVLKEHE